jgi:hypothetical protein
LGCYGSPEFNCGLACGARVFSAAGLCRGFDPRIREGIARALSVPEARSPAAWPIVHTQFLQERDPSTLGPKWALANALSVIAEESRVDELIELVRDRKHGENRAILVACFPRLADERLVPVLEELTQDPEIAADACKALDKLRRRLRRRKGK